MDSPAFPHYIPETGWGDISWAKGISKREYFAVMLMQGILAQGRPPIPQDAVRLADELIDVLRNQ